MKNMTAQQVKENLDQLKALAGENFSDYMIVVSDDEHGVFDTYSTKIAAHGMAAMVLQDIEEDWSRQRQELL